jgi:shikimate dehydrogenase
MHNAAFAHFDIDATYELRDLATADLAGFIDEARGEHWLGFQVTAPHKVAVIDYLDRAEDDVRAIGAVNSVAREESGALVGFNTDAPGFRRAAEQELQLSFAGVTAAVAGAGGAARAVVHALVSAGAARVIVGNRTADRAQRLAADFGPTVAGVGMGDAFDETLGGAGLAVNATTVGMHSDGSPFDVALLPDDGAVYDLVYSPAEPEVLRRARARGLRAANGLGMLVAQAEIAFERWTGIPDTGAVMRQALVDQGLVE